MQRNTCLVNGTCCYLTSLAGCYRISNEDCKACRNFLRNRKCLDMHPKDTFLFINKNYLTEQLCREIQIDTINKNSFFPIQNKCMELCPPGFRKIKVAI